MEREILNTRVVIIGSGNVATHIANGLCRKVSIIQVYSHAIENAQILAQKIGCSNVACEVSTICDDADIYIVSIKDDAIESVINSVKCRNNSALWVHTSGSKPITVFENSGINNYGVLYPLQTFSKEVDINMGEVPFFVEGNNEKSVSEIKKLAQLISPKIYEADSEKRRQLHIAAVFACNFANHMWVLAADLLKNADLPFDILLPLIKESVRKLGDVPPIEGQTGPAVRGDREIINKHLSMLEDEKKEIYKIISESIIKYSL